MKREMKKSSYILLATTGTAFCLVFSVTMIYMVFLAADAALEWAGGKSPQSPTVVVEGEIKKVDFAWDWRNEDGVKLRFTFKERYTVHEYNHWAESMVAFERTRESGKTPTLKMNGDKWFRIKKQHKPGGWWHKNRDKIFVITYRESDKRLLSMYPK